MVVNFCRGQEKFELLTTSSHNTALAQVNSAKGQQGDFRTRLRLTPAGKSLSKNLGVNAGKHFAETSPDLEFDVIGVCVHDTLQL